MRVEEITTGEVITVTADTTVEEIVKLLTEQRIGGLAAVDHKNQVIGIVPESDLFLKEKGVPFSAVNVPTLFKRWVNRDRLTEIYEDARHHTAVDVMTKQAASVQADDTIGHAAWLMTQHNVRRLPVLRNGALEGIVTRVDMMCLPARGEG